jgi:hypothetical protein
LTKQFRIVSDHLARFYQKYETNLRIPEGIEQYNYITLETETLSFDDDHIIIRINSDDDDERKARYVRINKEELRGVLDDTSSIKYPCANKKGSVFNSDAEDYSTVVSLFELGKISEVQILVHEDDMIYALNNNNKHYVTVKIHVNIPSIISKGMHLRVTNAMSANHCQGGFETKEIYKLFAVRH